MGATHSDKNAEHADKMAAKYASMFNVTHAVFREFAMTVLNGADAGASTAQMMDTCEVAAATYCKTLGMPHDQVKGAAIEIWITRYLGDDTLAAMDAIGSAIVRS